MSTAIIANRVFTTTHWSVVLGASQPESQHNDEALEKLCRAYWYPIYVFLQRLGWPAHDAEDLTQSFFTQVLQREYLRAVDRRKGKFRSFLLAMLRHFVANHRRDARAQKRGGRFYFVGLDDESVDEVDLSPVAMDAAEQSYDRQWASTLLEQVMDRLHQEYAEGGKSELFDELKAFLALGHELPRYADLAARFHSTEAALKMAVSRLRKRYAELLRAEIGRTVSSPEEVDDELRALFAALS